MFDNSGNLSFGDSQEDVKKRVTAHYKVLIVDDEPSVHDVTLLALEDIQYNGKKMEILHAYSATEAEEILRKEDDIAVIFLDVVMETDTAGLDLVKIIRTDIKNTTVRIILRTGQPGQAPEEDVIVNYDINDYKNKTELTTQKLFTSLITALRSYSDLIKIERNRQGLEKVLVSTSSIVKLKYLDEFFSGLLEQVISLTCSDMASPEDKLSSYIGFYKVDELVFEVGTGVYGDKGVLDSLIIQKYAKEIEKVRKDKEVIRNDDSLIIYKLNDDNTAILMILEGEVGQINLENSMLELFMNNAAVTYDNLLLSQDVKESQKDTIFMLSEMAEQRSKETGKHVKRVAYIAKEIGEDLGLNRTELEELFVGAPMHDIGKIGVRDGVLKKPGPLSDEEFDEMKLHTVLGYDLLKNSEKHLMRMAGVISHEHHEKWNGKGYPRGLIGDDIHIFARIVALCDVFDALSNPRVYKEAWSIDTVLDLIKEEKGEHFDPKVVDAFFNRLDNILKIHNEMKD